MQHNENHNPNATQLEGAKRLTEGLKALYGVDLQIPGDVDGAIGEMAKQHFAAKKSRRGAAWWGGVATAAAAVLLVVLYAPQFLPKAEQSPPVATEAPESASVHGDVDGSGEVDILDAFALARMIREKPTESTTWDMTNDGLVDEGDVNAVAMVAVKLRQGEVQ